MHSFGTAAVALACSRGLRARRLSFVARPEDLDVYAALFARAFGLRGSVYERLVRGLEQRFTIDWQELRHITLGAADGTPLLVVNDTDDAETPLAGARAAARAWPNGELLATRNLGHRRILRDAQVIARVVDHLADQLADQRGASAPELLQPSRVTHPR